jgi:hypothetical protein
MTEVTYSVFPVQAGWAVQEQPNGPPMMFFSGGRAEAAARRLCKAAWRLGVTAEVHVHSRDGDFVGGWGYSNGRQFRLEPIASAEPDFV